MAGGRRAGGGGRWAAPAGVDVRGRVIWVFAALAVVLAALGVRVFWVQIWRGASLYQQAVDVHTRVVPVPARRGEILDAEGSPLAISVGVDSVYAVPAQVTDRVRESAALAEVLDLQPTQVEQRLSRRVAFIWVKRKVSDAQAAAVRRLNLPGIHLLAESRRVYPRGMFAAQVLGFVGIDNQGLQGVELTYDKELRGTPGALLLETDARNRDIPQAEQQYESPTDGLTLRLTINSTLQSLTQRYLDAGVAQAGALGGYAIMMDPSTGDILALAAWPTFDPNTYAQADPSLWTNPLIAYTFSPGSVFKPITASGALQEGLLTPNTGFDDGGALRVGGVTIYNYNHQGLGHVSFATAFQKSSNTIFGRVGLMLGRERFYKYLRLFGFTEPTGVDLPGGRQNPNLLRPEQLATPLDVAEEAFGQTLAVTPLSMVTALSAIANGGELMWPHVGMDLETADGRVVQRIAPRVVRRVLSPEVAYQVQTLMGLVVSGGSGRRAQIPCYTVAGKTGTTQKYRVGGSGISGQYIGSFMGYAPVHGARLALYVMIDEPQGVYYGGQVAGPIFQQIMSRALRYEKVPPSCPPGVSPQVPGSTPLETVTMPDLLGLSRDEAVQNAAAAGLALRVQGTGPRILRQVPAAGEGLAKGSTVLAYTTPALALPQPTVTVPDLQGLTLARAAAALGVQGLQLDGTGAGVVVAQSPPPGATLRPGDVVHVTLGRAAAASSGSSS